MCTACERLIKAIDACIRKADEKLSGILGEEGFAEPEDTVSHIEALEDELDAVFEDQSRAVAEKLEQADGSDVMPAFESFKAADTTRDSLYKIFLGAFTDYVPQLANVYISDMDSELVVEQISEKTSGWINDWSDELSELMHISSQSGLEKILSDGLKEGKGVDEVARDILDSGIRNAYYKARRVAQTEMLRAHSVAREESIQQCPAAEFKEWVHTGGHKNKPRENHVKMNGQIVPKDQPFKLIGRDGVIYYPKFPRDTNLPASESVNCHCIHRGAASERILALSLEERKKLQQQAVEEMGDEWEKELDARNKAKAGINEDTIKCDWLRSSKTVEERKRYFHSDSRWALFESGVIRNDQDLERLYKTVDTKYGPRKVFKTLTELKNDGIITVPDKALKHSVYGTYKPKSKEYPKGRLASGGHTYSAMKECDVKGVEYSVNKKFSNGVCLGNVPSSLLKIKRNKDAQSWFPEDWGSDKVLLAGTYTANKGTLIEPNRKVFVYDGVAVRTLIYDEVDTICPDLDQDKYIEGVNLIDD